MSKFIPTKLKNLFKSMRPPSTNAVLAAAKAVTTPVSLKPHVPMIKFRGTSIHPSVDQGSRVKGVRSSPPSQGTSAAIQISNAQTSSSKPNASSQNPIIEDWQLPLRYRRRLIDQQEIDYINRGGPE